MATNPVQPGAAPANADVVVLRPGQELDIPAPAPRHGRLPKNVISLRPPRRGRGRNGGLLRPQYKFDRRGDPIEPRTTEKLLEQRQSRNHQRQYKAIKAAREGNNHKDRSVWIRISVAVSMDDWDCTEAFSRYSPNEPAPTMLLLEDEVTDTEVRQFREILGGWIADLDGWRRSDLSNQANRIMVRYYEITIEGMKQFLACHAEARRGTKRPLSFKGAYDAYIASAGEERRLALDYLLNVKPRRECDVFTKLKIALEEGVATPSVLQRLVDEGSAVANRL